MFIVGLHRLKFEFWTLSGHNKLASPGLRSRQHFYNSLTSVIQGHWHKDNISRIPNHSCWESVIYYELLLQLNIKRVFSMIDHSMTFLWHLILHLKTLWLWVFNIWISNYAYPTIQTHFKVYFSWWWSQKVTMASWRLMWNNGNCSRNGSWNKF